MSDEDDSSFMRGLQEIGLALSDDDAPPKPAKTTKEKSIKKKSTGGRPRRMPRTQINVDDLLDGIDLGIPNQTVQPNLQMLNAEPVSKAQSTQQINITPQFNSPLLALEHSVNSYLSRSLKMVTDSFIVELENIFTQSNIIDPMVNNFTESLRQTIQEEFQEQEIPPIQFNCELLDMATINFKDHFKDANQFLKASPTQKIQDARSARLLLSSRQKPFDDQFADQRQQLQEALAELSAERVKEKSLLNELKTKNRTRQRNMLDLQGKMAECNCQLDYIKLCRDRIEESRRSLDESDHNYEPLSDQIRREIISIRSLVKSSSVSSKQHLTKIRQYHDIIQSIASIRPIFSSQYQYAVNQTNALRSLPITTYQPVIIEEEEESPVKGSVAISNERLVNSFRQKLASIQNTREETLNDISSYVSQVKRREYRRGRASISRLALDSD